MCAGTPEESPASGGCLLVAGFAILSGHGTGTARGTHLRLPREGSLFLKQEDRNLVTAASRGDVEAFAKLVRDNSSLVYRVALRMLGNDDAQDASQEVWVRVWRNIRGFRGESAFSTWLYRITVNTCLSFRQRELRRDEHELGEEVPYLSEPQGGDADPEAAALNAERREEIEDALQRVRAEHRAALVLRHMEGLSYSEIAEVLEVPDGTAKGWVSRGRAAMLVVLADKDGFRGGPKEEEGGQ
jgi:RNA polymerase sigma-70 factor (ECF subfamily)